jgi:hypothetical protein
MEITRLKVADAINYLDCDPFTCADVLWALGVSQSNGNKEKVQEILSQFKKRKWLHNSTNNLYWRTFNEFTF